MIRLSLALPLMLAPALALAQDIAPGRYSLDAAHCATPGHDGVVTFEPGAIRFHESRCTLGGETPVRDMEGAALYHAECGGEGETWTRRLLLLPLMDGGLAIAQEGAVAAYARCGD